MFFYQQGDIVIEVVDGNVLEGTFCTPRDEAVVRFLHLEEDLQDRYDEHEREDVQDC